MDKVILMIVATLVAGAISEDRLKKEIVLGKLFFEKSRKMTVSHNYRTEYNHPSTISVTISLPSYRWD